MVRFGINPSGTLGISVVDLRRLARDLGADHALAQRLWASGIHEARILASFIDDPRLVTAAHMDLLLRSGTGTVASYSRSFSGR
jgi:3-methyladenine DNA glycosylase AlkD